ncbi:CPBP family intramembrane glutamic endopeptidase [Paraburkholderia tropica]|uniref:CPBP family intramembrane glutamic endopeptidase n=1 Tax=Paraburkholderia tropica TaxID=92647 RepID=UPI00161806B9|nr:CPBP family intramembrane glutamic endopeptidase [Paraburkholderia tropica]MBB2984569.1 membrane protease YdiL (CAAX protease family) [Paraburkholderia tropica]
MKSNNDFARAFVDLAKLGRTDWRALALTILILALLSAVGTLGSLMLPIPGMQAYRNLYLHHFSLALAVQNILTDAGGPVGVLGFWLACKFILRRPFASLISVDLKFSAKRFLLGAAIYLPAFMVGVALMWIYARTRFGIWTSPVGYFHPQQDTFSFSGILGLFVEGLMIAFMAFGEELYLRGWMTQTLGQYIRAPVAVAVLVAILFAIFHKQYGWSVKMVMFFNSLGFSVLSLRDRRLELAIGAHSMSNIWVTLTPMIFTGQHSNAKILIPDAVVFALIKSALPYALMFLFLQKTSGWFTPAGERLSNNENAAFEEPCA